jgi:PST family polysaccharide transporter
MITRLIGPRQYGLYAAGAGLTTYLASFGTWGIDVFLLRDPEEPTQKHYACALTLLLAVGAMLTSALIAVSKLIALFLHMPDARDILVVLSFGILPAIISSAGAAKLGRELEFKKVAINELTAQIGYYVVALPLAFKGAGTWAPVAGWVAQQWTLAVVSFITSKLRPVLGWDTKLARGMVSSGLTYSSSIWVWQLRSLVNPMIVGRLAGAEAVAYVSLAIRVTDLLSFAKTATWRIALAALSKLQNDFPALRRSVAEGMRLQAIAVGVPLVTFGLVAPYIIPTVFGHKWIPVLQVFPFVAISYLSNAMFNLHSSVLYVLRQNMKVTYFHLAHIFLFAGTAIFCVRRFGFLGYGWGEMAGLLAYVLIHYYFRRATGDSPSYSSAAVWYGVAAVSIAAVPLGPPFSFVGLILPLFPLAIESQRSFVRQYYQLFRGTPECPALPSRSSSIISITTNS